MNKFGVQDSRLIRREIYNPNAFELIFERMQDQTAYVFNSGITPGPLIVICKPEGFCILNHAFYICRSQDGRPGSYISNFGDSIGKGNKKPSRMAGTAFR